MKKTGLFDQGYDIVGSLGSNPAEIAALEEDAVVKSAAEATKAMEVVLVAEGQEDNTATPAEATHVLMTEGEINQLNVLGLKEQLSFRRVPFKYTLKKADLMAKLREALDQEAPCYTQQQLNALSTKAVGSKKKVYDMSDFAVGAY
jgi:hypothetical protein